MWILPTCIRDYCIFRAIFCVAVSVWRTACQRWLNSFQSEAGTCLKPLSVHGPKCQSHTHTHTHAQLSEIIFFPGSIAKGSSSKSGCKLHLPTSHANLSRVTSPANLSCQPLKSYFTCQLLMPTLRGLFHLLTSHANFTCQLRLPTFRELCHLPTSHANFSIVTSPANFSCQLFGCYLIILKAQANFSGVTSLS